MSENKYTVYRKCWEEYLVGAAAMSGEMDHGTDCGSTPENDVYSRELVRSVQNMADAPAMKFGFIEGFYTSAHLQALTLAWRTPGTTYYQRPEVLQEIGATLSEIENRLYNPGITQANREEWWMYEVGIPLRLFNVLVMVHDDLEDIAGHIQRITDTFLVCRDLYTQSSGRALESGANMVWKCSNLLLAGILRGEDELIREANEKLVPVLQYSHMISHPGYGEMPDDGFYEDGSFIQHYMFGYTGGYGKHLLSVLAGLLYAFRGQDCLVIPEQNLEFLFEMIHRCYEPLIYKGHFMDIARGREVARPWFEDRICGRIVMRAIVYLTQIMPEQEKVRSEKMLASWLAQEDDWTGLLTDEHPHSEYNAYGSLPEVVRKIRRDLEESAASAEIGERGVFHTFDTMCKPVYRAQNYAFAISMYSRTIACYERLGHEGDTFWHFSDGQTFLYNGGGDAFCRDYYGTVDMQRLPGTTVERAAGRAEDPYYSWYLPESRNTCGVAGSAALGSCGAAAQQYLGQGNGKERTLEVKKSWFLFGKEIVCMGSGITSPTDNPVETIVENRKLSPDADNVITVSGSAAFSQTCRERSGSEWTGEVQTAHLTGEAQDGADIGYWFPEKIEVHLLAEQRSGVWALGQFEPEEVRDKEVKHNSFLTMWIGHGAHPEKASYTYVLLPGISRQDLDAYAAEPDVKILECSEKVHAVWNRREQTLGIVFFEENCGPVCGITCGQKAVILLHNAGNGWERMAKDASGSGKSVEIIIDENELNHSVNL